MLSMALTIFVDVRGFTRWCADSDVHAHVVEFIDGFDEILIAEFKDFNRKQLGDGAMLVRILSPQEQPIKIIEEVIETIDRVNDNFGRLCNDFYDTHGVNTRLHLGWGITRGDVWSRRADGLDDFVGKNINEAARLCSKARPHGIVIDSDDFRKIPEPHGAAFEKITLGLDEFTTTINVWVTKEIANHINPSERARENPQVFVSGVCMRRESGKLEVLAMKRDVHREFFPNLLEVTTGGQMGKDEGFTDGVLRYFLQELALEVDIDRNHSMTYEFSNREGELIPGVRYVCWHVSGQPQLVHYQEFHWLTAEKFKAVPDDEFLPGAKAGALALLERLKP